MRKRVLIKVPKVHNLGYRLFLLEEADRLGLVGFDAKNLMEEGMQVIDVVVEGESRKVDSFLNFVRTSKPEGAEVKEVRIEGYEGEVRSIESFYRFFSVSQLSKIVTIGTSILNEQREMRAEFRQNFKALGEKIDSGFKALGEKIDSGFKALGEKIDSGFKESIEKEDQILHEIKNLRTDLGSRVEERLQRLERDVRLIKERLKIG